ncbi:hypothetical protein KYY02_23855 [Streptomyces pimonensis]|uniref:Uncharacterized protein n=1 Tax=Streptomyces pimonensis TaxID=2860288 RepID=A0ABV4J713_9ACTN
MQQAAHGVEVAAPVEPVERLAELRFSTDRPQTTTSVGDLAKAGALSLRSGQQPVDGATAPGRDSVPLLTVAALLTDGTPGGLVAAGSAPVTAEEGDVVVAGVVRAYRAWVHEGPRRPWSPSCTPCGWTRPD